MSTAEHESSLWPCYLKTGRGDTYLETQRFVAEYERLLTLAAWSIASQTHWSGTGKGSRQCAGYAVQRLLSGDAQHTKRQAVSIPHVEPDSGL